MGLVLSRVSSSLEAKLLPSAPWAELMHSPDPVGFVLCLIQLLWSNLSIHPQCVCAQPQTGSYIQCDNPRAQTHSPDQENCLS